MPHMVVVAGPPGSGKSTLLRPDEDSLAYFNADERARDLNHGSGHNISPEIRAQVNRDLEVFIMSHIREGRSFSFETSATDNHHVGPGTACQNSWIPNQDGIRRVSQCRGVDQSRSKTR
jgi:predicted ABC-type ATPase